MMGELEFAEIMKEALFTYHEELLEYNENFQLSIESFEDAGLLTRDKGIVVKINDWEFQVTINRTL
jgi:hypothetical protein